VIEQIPVAGDNRFRPGGAGERDDVVVAWIPEQRRWVHGIGVDCGTLGDSVAEDCSPFDGNASREVAPPQRALELSDEQGACRELHRTVKHGRKEAG